jgi:hypothetical protein
MMKRFAILFLLTAAAGYLMAKDAGGVKADSETTVSSFNSGSDASATLNQGATIPDNRPDAHSGVDSTIDKHTSTPSTSDATAGGDESERKAESFMSKVQWGATVDMQVDKDMWDEYGRDSKNRLQYESLNNAIRRSVDDFWMRVAVRGMYQSKNFESAFALRFYPYWTMRRKGPFQDGKDLDRYLDVFEINQAYLKAFKEYGASDNKYALHFKVGRDGLLSTGSQLFGNYLELPTAGYGESLKPSVVGPFKNRKVFANMMEVGFSFNRGDVFGAKTSLMIGGNVNNQKWYSAPVPPISEEMDSKLSAGFTRGYQDFYFLKERIHLGAGFRIYTAKVTDYAPVIVLKEGAPPETTTTNFTADSKYVNGEWTFDFTVIPNCKFYSEFGYQKLGARSTTGIIRPFTAGITIPTGGVLDVLALEIENVANTYFSTTSMRDAVGTRKITNSFAWGIVTEKWLVKDRAGIAWGVYTGDAYGDMKTSLRLSSSF